MVRVNRVIGSGDGKGIDRNVETFSRVYLDGKSYSNYLFDLEFKFGEYRGKLKATKCNFQENTS